MSVAVERMVRRLNLSGVHGFDFLLEAHTGNAYLIEINPRATQVGHLALGPGRDLPAALYATLAGKAVESAPKATEKDTIALFPQEWMRDPESAFLRSGYHDVPWEERELVRACVRRNRKQRAWYSQQNWIQAFSALRLRTPMTAPPKGRAVQVELGSKVNPDIRSECAPGQSHPLRVMKFGGTSVGDASCIAKVVEIIRAASRESNVVVVVSAMSGVTNKLIAAATQSEAGDPKPVASIFEELRKQHDAAVSTLIHSAAERNRIGRKMQEVFQEGDRLCQDTILLRELTPRARDSISSLGERLSAPLLAAALAERGVASEAIDATELIV